jgi:hypothetical protein
VRVTARAHRPPREHAWREQEKRNARLLFDAELTAGTLSPEALCAAATRRAVRAAVRVRPVPPLPVRLGEQALCRLGRPPAGQGGIGPPLAARRAVCGEAGDAAAGGAVAGGVAGGGDGSGQRGPRILLRVDEFPHYQAWDQPQRFGTERFMRFHEILAGAGVHYLLAVPPRVSRAPLSPDGAGSRGLDEAEAALLGRLAGERVAFALHGRDHRTRFASPRRRSELCGLTREQTEELLDGALAELAEHDIATSVFVPPFNRFDARQLPWLARRFAVVCGGPESIGKLGFQGTPQWRGETVYLPSYAPFYGRASEVLQALPHTIERARGLWLPVVLHWGWEADAGWRELERLATRIAPHTAPWEEFLAAVERSRGGASAER